MEEPAAWVPLTEAKRREIRNAQHELSESVDVQAPKFMQPGDKSFREHLEKSQVLFDEIKGINNSEATEFYLPDAVHLKRVTKIATDRTRELHVSHSYTLDTLSQAINSLVRNEKGQEDWSTLARQSFVVFEKAPRVPPFLLGPITVHKEPRKRKEKAKIDTQTAHRVQPKAVVSSLYPEENETAKRVGEVKHLLEATASARGGQINFFDFVLDPESYTQTVENIFHFSFLIKEGFASLECVNGEMEARPREAPKTDDGSSSRQQCIISLDMNAWKSAVGARNLAGRKPVIPHRDYSALIQQEKLASEKSGSDWVKEEQEDGSDEEDEDEDEEPEREKASRKRKTVSDKDPPRSQKRRRED